MDNVISLHCLLFTIYYLLFFISEITINFKQCGATIGEIGARVNHPLLLYKDALSL